MALRRLLIFILFSILSAGAAGADTPQRFDFYKSSQMQHIEAGCYFSKALTPAGSIPSDSSFFDFNDPRSANLGEKYWMRFTLTNQESHPVEIQLFPGLSEELYLFMPTDTGFVQYPIGTFEPRSSVRDIWGHGKTFLSQALVELDAHETKTYYFLFNHLSGGQQAKRDAEITPRLMYGPDWESKIRLSNLIWSFIFGCFVILILYHFVFYFLTKDATYLYYCLFVFAVSFPFYTLIADVVDQPKYSALLFFTVSGLFSVFYFQLTRRLIGLSVLLPKWDRILKISIIIKSVLVLFYTIAYQFQQDIFIILSIYIPAIAIELILMIFLVVALVKTRDKIAIYFVLGSSLAWLSMMIAILLADSSNSLTPQLSPFKFATPAIGFVLKSLVFAMVLSYRARLNELEKKKVQDALILQLQENKSLQDKVNRELEEKVLERTNEIQMERQKSEKLLLNILPQSVVQEMKKHGRSVPKRFENVSILFADFVGFTAIASQMSPEALVQHLNTIFASFDAIMKKHGLEKIKTIGDAYLAACGLPTAVEKHAEKTILAAIDMINFIENYNRDHPSEHGWHVRIGVHTGEVVAGVIGDYKFTYDIWGDAVNLASRMESSSESGKINISKSTYDLLNTNVLFHFENRGKIAVKGKGAIEMIFVSLKNMQNDH